MFPCKRKRVLRALIFCLVLQILKKTLCTSLVYQYPNLSTDFTVTLLSQQQRKEREMVRQQEKGPHRRLDDMRREEDRRLAEREQVTNHRRCGSAISQSA